MLSFSALVKKQPHRYREQTSDYQWGWGQTGCGSRRHKWLCERQGFPGGSDSEESAEMWEAWVRSLGREDPWRRAWKPTPVFLLENPHGQRSLAGYSPWGHKESEQLSTAHHMILLPFSFFQLIFLLKDSCFKEFCFLSNLNMNLP